MSLAFLFLSICSDSGQLISDSANSTVIPILEREVATEGMGSGKDSSPFSFSEPF